MDSAVDKQRLRQTIRRERPHSSEGLTSNLVRLSLELGARRIASYASDAQEPSTADFNAWVTSLGLDLLLPRVVGNDLQFASGELTEGSFGILEPSGPAQELNSVDLILLPALAVDKSGVRLGKGKGYYDRALESISGIPLYAVVYDSEIFEQLPHEPHDRQVTGAVTPTALHHFRASSIS